MKREERRVLDILNEPAVQGHINMLQKVIERMSKNSSTCKAWVIALMTAMLAIVFKSEDLHEYILILIVPTLSFYFLDCYYLAIERNAARNQDSFLKAILNNEDYLHMMYKIRQEEPQLTSLQWRKITKQFTLSCLAMNSISTTPFYLLLFILVLILAFIY